MQFSEFPCSCKDSDGKYREKQDPSNLFVSDIDFGSLQEFPDA
jgi:hypothetical protein